MGTFLTVVGVIIVILYFILLAGYRDDDKKSTTTYAPSRPKTTASALLQSERRLQIINESLSLIDKTNNLAVLNGRYDTVCAEIDWMYDNGIELSDRTREDAHKMVDENKNENIVRIAKSIKTDCTSKISALKTKKGKDNATSKMNGRLSECLVSLVDSSNKDYSIGIISSLMESKSKVIVDASHSGCTNKADCIRSDIERWRKMDFVVGYEIKLGTNTNHCDICEELAGKYPLSFNWDGWYDGCRCYVTPIMKTDDEFFADDSESSKKSVNRVRNVPKNFKNWVVRNKDLIAKYEEEGTLPSFILNNKNVVDRILRTNR